MTVSPKLGVVEISTLWHYRLPLPIQMFIKVVSSPRLSGIGMPSLILWSHLLKMQRIVLLSSLLWWELGTNSLITGPGEWLSFRRFTSKLSWADNKIYEKNHNQHGFVNLVLMVKYDFEMMLGSIDIKTSSIYNFVDFLFYSVLFPISVNCCHV